MLQTGQLQTTTGELAGMPDLRHHGIGYASAQQGLGAGEGLIVGDGVELDQAGRVQSQTHQAGRIEIADPRQPENRLGVRQAGQQRQQKSRAGGGVFGFDARCGELMQHAQRQPAAKGCIDLSAIHRDHPIRLRRWRGKVQSCQWIGRGCHSKVPDLFLL